MHRKYELSTILVSHDSAEIGKMADEVLVLEKGKIVKQGNASDIFGLQNQEVKVISIEEKGDHLELTLQRGRRADHCRTKDSHQRQTDGTNETSVTARLTRQLTR